MTKVLANLTFSQLRDYVILNRLPIKTSHVNRDTLLTNIQTYLAAPMPNYTKEMLDQLTRKDLLDINKMYHLRSGNKKTKDLKQDILDIRRRYTRDELDKLNTKELKRIAFINHISANNRPDLITAILALP